MLPLDVPSSTLCSDLTQTTLALPVSACCLPEVSSSPKFLLLSYESYIPSIGAALSYAGRLQG